MLISDEHCSNTEQNFDQIWRIVGRLDIRKIVDIASYEVDAVVSHSWHWCLILNLIVWCGVYNAHDIQ